MKSGLPDVFIKWFSWVLLVVIVVGGVMMVYPTYMRCQSLKNQESELKAKIEAKKAEIARLADYQQRFRSDPDFVEMIARQNRRVYPGELVFIFED